MIRNERVTAPTSKGGQEFQKANHQTLPTLIPETQKFLLCCSIAIRVPK